jgi:UPF0716 protein FxsA
MPLLFIMFIVVPAIELILLLRVGSVIGPANTLLLVIITGVTGAYLARTQGFIVIQKIQNSLNKGIIPGDEMLDGLLILIGGIVLLTPGFFTDFLGLLFLFPPSRKIFTLLLKSQFSKSIQIHSGATFSRESDYQQEDSSDIIDI